MSREKKVVQTTLTRDEYDLLTEALSKKGLNIQDGLRKAVLAMVDSNFEIDPNDPFFKTKVAGRGPRDLSGSHDRYLYQGEARRRSTRRFK